MYSTNQYQQYCRPTQSTTIITNQQFFYFYNLFNQKLTSHTQSQSNHIIIIFNILIILSYQFQFVTNKWNMQVDLSSRPTPVVCNNICEIVSAVKLCYYCYHTNDPQAYSLTVTTLHTLHDTATAKYSQSAYYSSHCESKNYLMEQ